MWLMRYPMHANIDTIYAKPSPSLPSQNGVNDHVTTCIVCISDVAYTLA